MKFDVQISDWARWVAQDADGQWWEHESTPSKSTHWRSFHWTSPAAGRATFLCTGPPPADWTQEIYEVVWR